MKEKNNFTIFLSNVLWMLFDKIFVYGFNFFVTLNVANYYGTTDYGNYQYILSVVSIFGIFITFIDGRVVKKYYLSESGDSLTWNATIASFICSVVSLLIGLIYVCFCNETNDVKSLFIILLLNSIILGMRFGMQCRYEYALQSKKIVISSDLALFIGGLCQLVVIRLNCEIIFIGLVSVLSSSVNLSILYYLYIKQFKKLRYEGIDYKLLKKLFKYSLPFSVGGACAIIYSKCDSIMIGNIVSKSDVAIYSIANSFIAVTLMAIDPIRESIFPKLVELYNSDKEQYINLYIKITSFLTWICISGISASLIILPVVIKLLKPEYSASLSVYYILAFNSLFMYNAALRAGHYTIINSGHILMISQIISVLINLLLNLVLIKKIGVYGASIATVCTQFLSLYLSNFFWGEKGMDVIKWQIKGFNPLYCYDYLKHIMSIHRKSI